MLQIRHAEAADFPRLPQIYARARRFMAEQGNPRQWGLSHWPPEALLQEDIRSRRGYVCTHGDRVVGAFFYVSGLRVEPTYARIEGEGWQGPEEYGVIHRLASDGSVPGVGRCAIGWALRRCPALRVDTHPDNRVMQRLLGELGFVCRGIIHVEEDDDPRLAYELF